MREHRLLLRDIDIPDIERLEAYVACGGYRAVEKALGEMAPGQVVDEVARSGLRNRGGDWRLLADRWRGEAAEGIEYLCIDAHESEPGSFSDRKLIERHPHQLVEGIILAGYALGARVAYVYIRDVMRQGRELLQGAVDEARARGFLGDDILGSGYDLEIYLHTGAGAYIAGEPTAMLRALEGRRAEPRGAGEGPTLFDRPVLVENAGTLMYLPHIVARGAEWFRQCGTADYPGTCVFSVSGHVRRPGLYELELGAATLRELIGDGAGGVRQGHVLKGVLTGGASSPVLRPEQLDVRLSPEDWAVPGGGKFPGVFGRGGIIVMDETTCMVEAALNLMAFFSRESCGQCPSCRAGSRWLWQVLRRIEAGQGRVEDLELVESVAAQVAPLLQPGSATLCSFGAAFAWPVQGFVQSFWEEFEQHVKAGRCPVDKDRSIKVPETVSVRF